MQEQVGLRLYDTLTRETHPVPLSVDDSGQPLLRLYVCGITPYDSGHIGHAFTYIAFDVLIRYLEALGVGVCYVQNVTDVDTPLFQRAREDGVDWKELARREEMSFVRDMEALGWRAPDIMPKASEELDAIRSSIEKLRQNSYTYTTDSTYFSVERYPRYGQLSRRTRSSMIEKLRHEELLGEVGPNAKRDPLDFALWLESEPGEPSWPSPFGEGRPGWHIECSAMSMRHLGPTLDIHGGGRDLVFSHHESERAQSESLTGHTPFARLWMHTGLVHCDGEKMSKSLGNLALVREALPKASAAALRVYLLSHHYRSDWEFHWEELHHAAERAERLRPFSAVAPVASLASVRDDRHGRRFLEALEDDLDTPRAITVIEEAAESVEPALAASMLQVLVGTASFDTAPVAVEPAASSTNASG